MQHSIIKKQRMRSNQSGAQLIEFALTLPVFLIIIYLIVCYSIVFLLQQTISFAANEGARAGLSVPLSTTTRTANATARINAILSSLPATYRGALTPTITEGLTPASCGSSLSSTSGFQCLSVVLNYNFSANPGIVIFPPVKPMLPTNLSAKATVLYEN